MEFSVNINISIKGLDAFSYALNNLANALRGQGAELVTTQVEPEEKAPAEEITREPEPMPEVSEEVKEEKPKAKKRAPKAAPTKESEEEPAEEETKSKEKPEPKEEPSLAEVEENPKPKEADTAEDDDIYDTSSLRDSVRDTAGNLARAGKTKQIKELLASFGAERLSELPDDKLEEFAKGLEEI